MKRVAGAFLLVTLVTALCENAFANNAPLLPHEEEIVSVIANGRNINNSSDNQYQISCVLTNLERLRSVLLNKRDEILRCYGVSDNDVIGYYQSNEQESRNLLERIIQCTRDGIDCYVKTIAEGLQDVSQSSSRQSQWFTGLLAWRRRICLQLKLRGDRSVLANASREMKVCLQEAASNSSESIIPEDSRPNGGNSSIASNSSEPIGPRDYRPSGGNSSIASNSSEPIGPWDYRPSGENSSIASNSSEPIGPGDYRPSGGNSTIASNSSEPIGPGDYRPIGGNSINISNSSESIQPRFFMPVRYRPRFI